MRIAIANVPTQPAQYVVPFREDGEGWLLRSVKIDYVSAVSADLLLQIVDSDGNIVFEQGMQAAILGAVTVSCTWSPIGTFFQSGNQVYLPLPNALIVETDDIIRITDLVAPIDTITGIIDLG